MNNTRIERDSMGELQVPEDALYGAQTQRAVDNFPISGKPMPVQFIRALILAKAAAAGANVELKQISESQGKAIVDAAQGLLEGNFMQHFPVDIFQTGSGTSSNMNANEVIATLASRLLGEQVNPNDHVNCGQSSNDIIPTTIHVSAALALHEQLLPTLVHLVQVIEYKAEQVHHHVKTGRTHLMDAMPVRMRQVADIGLELLRPTVEHLTHAHRHGIHQVSAAGFDVMMNLLGLVLDHLHQMHQRRQQLLVQRQCGTDVDGGRNDVVAALAAVDVIVGVHRLAEQSAGQGGDHFVGVHVGAGARASLEDIHREVLHKVAFEQPLRRVDDGFALGLADLLELDVGPGGGSLCQDQRADELHRHRFAADREVIHRALGLRAIEGVFGDLKLAHAVTFDTRVIHREILAPVL